MTPDIMDADIAGHGRLTKVFWAAGQALLKKPLPLMGAGAVSFLPLGVYVTFASTLIQRYPALSRWGSSRLTDFLPPPSFLLILLCLSFSFALSAGPLCALAARAMTPGKKTVSLPASLRSFLPMFGLWLGIFLLMLVWGVSAATFERYLPAGTDFLIYIWLLLLLALLCAMPAWFSLAAPVLTLEAGSLREKIRRINTLGKGYRWRSIGYAMAAGVAGFIVSFALATALVASVPASVRFQIDDWMYLVTFGIFWMTLCVMATALYMRVRIAHGEFDPQDVANVFA